MSCSSCSGSYVTLSHLVQLVEIWKGINHKTKGCDQRSKTTIVGKGKSEKNASKVLNGEMNEDGCQYAIYENRHATLHIIMELPWISCLLSNRVYYFHTIFHFVFQYIYICVCVFIWGISNNSIPLTHSHHHHLLSLFMLQKYRDREIIT